jgi:hypothetical protein
MLHDSQRNGMARASRERRSSAGASSAFFTGRTQLPDLEQLAARTIGSALQALVHQDQARFDALVGTLTVGSGGAALRPFARRALHGYLLTSVTRAWELGWQPVDLIRFVDRERKHRHVQLLGMVIATEIVRYPADTVPARWTGQLEDAAITVWWPGEQTFLSAAADIWSSWTEAIAHAIELLSTIGSLPRLEQFGPAPGQGRQARSVAGAAAARIDVDERILSRVRALLAKAESTTFPAEAETFTAGAQALMARHSIDHALLASSAPGGGEKITGRRIGVENPYESAKAVLIDAVARANRCRSVWSQHLGFTTVVGYPADLDAVELLFTSLLVQATGELTRLGRQAGAGGRSRTRTFRQSFLLAFASRIGERLAETTTAQAEQAAAEPGGRNLLPVLASREESVRDAFGEMFPDLVTRPVSRTVDPAGIASGRAAADLASLHPGTAVGPG